MFKAYVPQQGAARWDTSTATACAKLTWGRSARALDPSDPALFRAWSDDLVESLDPARKRFEKRYLAAACIRERAFPPRFVLLKLWLLGAVVGVYSGRELVRQRRLHYDLRFRYLARWAERHTTELLGRSTDSGTVTGSSGTSERCPLLQTLKVPVVPGQRLGLALVNLRSGRWR